MTLGQSAGWLLNVRLAPDQSSSLPGPDDGPRRAGHSGGVLLGQLATEGCNHFPLTYLAQATRRLHNTKARASASCLIPSRPEDGNVEVGDALLRRFHSFLIVHTMLEAVKTTTTHK